MQTLVYNLGVADLTILLGLSLHDVEYYNQISL